MKKAWIIYQSKTGITKKFAQEIGAYLSSKAGLEAKVTSVQEFNNDSGKVADIIMLGCWTSGLMLMFQHPDKTWKKFAAGLPDLSGSRTALFTTYKIATGSMFKRMQKHLAGKSADVKLELKSRNGQLSEEHKQLIEEFLS